MWKGINGDIAGTLDSQYYRGCGSRGGREREVVYWVNDESIINGKRGGYVPMIVQPICFRPEQTIKVDGGGVAFTLESREFKAPQCVVIRNELSESDRLFKPRSASR